jgi:hypothetical protein
MKKDIFAVIEALREIQKNNATVSKRTINPEYFGTSKSLYNTSLALLTGRQLKEEAENKNKDEDDDVVNLSKDKNEKENENVKINPELKDEKDIDNEDENKDENKDLSNEDWDDEDWGDEDWDDEDWEDEDEEEKEDTEEDENESKKDNEEDEKDKEKKNKNVEESIYKNYPITYEKGTWKGSDYQKITKKLDLTKSKAFNEKLDGKNGENIRYPERVSFLLKHHDEHQNALKSGFTWRPGVSNSQRESIYKNYPVIYEKVNAQLFTREEIRKIKNILKGRN